MARLARSKWKLADAKNRFSELVNQALAALPQWVERLAGDVVVLDRREYQKLTGEKASFKDFLTARRPSLKSLDLSRDGSPMRRVKL